MTPDRPYLRAVDVQRIMHQGAPYYLLCDDTGVAEEQLLVPMHFGGLLALADGTRAIPAIIAQARLLYNTSVSDDEAHELFAALDEVGMLQGARYDALHAVALAKWRAQSQRPPALAGMGYPANKRKLWRSFQELLEEAQSNVIPSNALDWGRGVALLSPHLDYMRGGTVYAEVWKAMGQAVCQADVAVILATDHKGSDPFTLTTLDYATPYGVLGTDAPLRDALLGVIGESAAYAGELRHRKEHSVELVVNWLHHMRAGASLPIVPMLVGSFHNFMPNGSSPADDPACAAVIEVLRTEMQSRRLLIIASGDLAHVGPAFGGAPLDRAGIETVRDDDDKLLAAMASGGAGTFFHEIRRVGNANNVCGVAPIFLAMQATADSPGRTLAYEVVPADEQGTSVVSIAGVTFV